MSKDLSFDAQTGPVPIETFLKALHFGEKGLMPVIVQQYDTGQVLMLAWMDREALERSLRTGRMCYWSRSRQSYWVKGEQSGHFQALKALYADCDGDALLARVAQEGMACHTMRPSCFFWRFSDGEVVLSE